ncbi:MAG: dienelactone hydrolase family protein [Verrucomicrobiae bacterium]|nr:dienelactone hydrolase family protein [Verrucomicrobiae bacterium]
MKRKHVLGTAILALLAIPTAIAVEPGPDLKSRLQKRTFKDAQGDSLPYRIHVPTQYDKSRKYPLILFLHGAGGRGDDNQAQLNNAQVLRFISDEVAAQQPCIFVAPQCPKGALWSPRRPDLTASEGEPTKPEMLVLELLDALEKEFSVDPARRYVTGLSMGGFGSFDLCLRRPDYFAAAVPVCGGAVPANAKKMASVAFWIMHGADDKVIPPDLSRKMVEALQEAKAEVKYTEYPGVGHDSWVKAYQEPELVDWLFAHRSRPENP